MLPAVGQGALGIETRATIHERRNSSARSMTLRLAHLRHGRARAARTNFRAAARFRSAPWPHCVNDELHLEAGVFSADGSECVRCAESGPPERGGAGRNQLADTMIQRAREGFCGWRERGQIGRADKPLSGKRIVVTRAPEQAGELIREARTPGRRSDPRARGCLRSLPRIPAALDRALHELGRFDWVLFTSQNAVRFTVLRLKQLGLPAVDSANRRGGTGDSRSREARRISRGLRGDASRRRILWRRVAGFDRDHSVFLPRSDRADPELVQALRESGANVTEAIAYRTIAPDCAGSGGVERNSRRGSSTWRFFQVLRHFTTWTAFIGAGATRQISPKKCATRRSGPPPRGPCVQPACACTSKRRRLPLRALPTRSRNIFYEHPPRSRHS